MKNTASSCDTNLGTGAHLLSDWAMADLDVAYVPTPKQVVRQMLHLAQLRRGEVLFDLGAGDGRVMIEAARTFGAQVVGVEIDPQRISRLKQRLRSTGVSAQVIQSDFMDVDLSTANVVAIYLSESANAKLAPKLNRELPRGARVVSLDYPLSGWKPQEELVVKGALPRKLFLYRISKLTK